MNEQEEFEFRMRMEQEAAQAAPQEPPSAMAVAGNAAAKAVAGTADMFLNAPVNAYNVAKAGAVLAGDALGLPQVRENLEVTPQPNLAQRGLTAIGAIAPEREPQTPGQRILDLAVQTGVGMAAAPAAGLSGIARNAAMGMASGAAAGVTKEATGSDLAATAVGMAVPLLAHAATSSKANEPTLKNPVKSQTLKDAQAAGYVVPPSQVKPSFTTNKLEGMAGKAAVRQEAAIRNQTVTNDLAAQAIGLPKGTTITEGVLDGVRKEAGKVYDEVAQLRPTPQMPWFPRYHETDLVEQLKKLRSDATIAFKEYDRSAKASVLAKAQRLSANAASIEKDLVALAKANGKPELVKELSAARKLYAKTYDIERALNVGDGNVSAVVLGRMLDKGKPLSGELKIIGKFAQAFPSVTREGAMIPASGVSGTEAATSALLGTVGYGAAGGPAGLMAAGLPLLRSPARSTVLSGMYQRRLLKEAPALDQAMLKSVLAGRSMAEAL